MDHCTIPVAIYLVYDQDEENNEEEEVEFVEVKEEIILIKNQFDKLLSALDFDIPQISDKTIKKKT